MVFIDLWVDNVLVYWKEGSV